MSGKRPIADAPYNLPVKRERLSVSPIMTGRRTSHAPETMAGETGGPQGGLHESRGRAEVLVDGNDFDDYMLQLGSNEQQQAAEHDEIVAHLHTDYTERIGILKAEFQDKLRERDEKLARWKETHQKTLNDLRAKNAKLNSEVKEKQAKLEKLGKLAKLAKKVMKEFTMVEGMEKGNAIEVDG